VSPKAKILVVDDEPDLVELIAYNLRKEGFEVSSASNGEDALRMLRAGGYDLVVLDIMLPGIQGTELCRILRGGEATRSLPVIMLTARTEEVDRVLGLELGADDYVTKPFSPRELVARVKAVLRRAGEKVPGGEATLVAGDLTINRETYRVTKKGKPVDLSATEFRLLSYMAERPGRVFTRQQLLDAVWKDEGYVEPRTVDVHVRRLRAHIEDDPSDPRYVKTRRGIGYYFEAGP
jgi:phosphate regulon transcriptional regulator PhoB